MASSSYALACFTDILGKKVFHRNHHDTAIIDHEEVSIGWSICGLFKAKTFYIECLPRMCYHAERLFN